MNNLIWIEGVDGCQSCVIKKMCDKDTALKTKIFGSCSAVKGTYQIAIVMPEKEQEHSMQDIKLQFFLKDHGERCTICALDYDECSTECGDRGFFKIKTEAPEKKQTVSIPDFIINFVESQLTERLQRPIEYDLKLLDDIREWLKDNQPEDWQTCTKENTKNGDVVRFKNTGELREFEHICNDRQVILYNDAENKSFPVLKLENYEINLAEKSDCLPAEEC